MTFHARKHHTFDSIGRDVNASSKATFIGVGGVKMKV